MTRARHWTILLLAAGCVLALAGGLAACGGSADGALPPPESPPPPAATPAPAVPPVEPPATATPPTPPEPEPEPASEPPPATCTATTLGVDPATHPDLGADCAALLAAKDTLRGTGALNWDAATALTGWDGVTLSGTPQRVTGLDLRTRQLTGTIPAALADLDLTDLFLSENALSGCLPRELTQVTRSDVAQLNLDPCPLSSTTLSYGTPTTSGSVTDDGDYAFLTDPADLTTLVTTYEGLRDGSTTGLVIHQNDSSGASQADFYDLVEAGDLVEWRQAADCFVRYTVTEVKDDPAGSPPRKLLAVAWMTYAFTGCSGAISSTATASVQWGPLPALGGTSLAAPVIHGIYQLVPEDWTGTMEAGQLRHPPGVPPGPFMGGPLAQTEDLTVARMHAYWREPTLPSDWTFAFAVTGGYETSPIGYCAAYSNARGFGAVTICGDYATDQRFSKNASWLAQGLESGEQLRGVYETRVIAGRPARVTYSPPGTNHDPLAGIDVWIYDPPTEREYHIIGWTGSLRGANVDAVIAIARSLFEPPNPP